MSAINILWLVLASIVAYLLGSIPFSVWLGKLATGIDLRDYHSHNPGGFNAVRTYGQKIGVPIIFLDQFKGILAIALVDHLFSLSYFETSYEKNFIHTIGCILAPAMCIIGHNYSIWLKFKGGQGLGVYMGVLMYMNPLLLFIFFTLYTIFYVGFKISTNQAGAIVVLLCFPIALFLPLGPPWSNILLDWVVVGKGIFFLTQAFIIISMDFAMLIRSLHNSIFESNITKEQAFRKN
ncbi:MAG: glycerol-3-phosphate acyltransferase [Asgard group archaeon]|nr:glycerol-3-phosphate acyltransferase [Asgard group archaeon]